MYAQSQEIPGHVTSEVTRPQTSSPCVHVAILTFLYHLPQINVPASKHSDYIIVYRNQELVNSIAFWMHFKYHNSHSIF